MNGKIIFELKLNNRQSLIAYEHSDYETVYEDSFLALKTGFRTEKLVESSFVYGFGAEMYYRIYNINEIESLTDFPKCLEKCIECADDADKDTLGFSNKYYFVGCRKNISLYFGKKNGKYLLLKVRFCERYSDKRRVKITKIVEVSAENFQAWQSVIKSEWERRAIIEGTRDNDTSTDREQWEKYFEYMRS